MTSGTFLVPLFFTRRGNSSPTYLADRLKAGLVAPSRGRMREFPVKLARSPVNRARLQVTLINAADRRHLGVVAGGKYFVRCLKVGITQRGLDDRGAGLAQQRNDARPRDAGEE